MREPVRDAPRMAFVVTVDSEGRQRLWRVTYDGWMLLDDKFMQPNQRERPPRKAKG